MRRRAFLAFGAGAAVFPPVAARAQQRAMPVIGYLGTAAPSESAPYVAALLQGLGESGFVEGQNLAIESRWAEGRYERLPSLAAELVDRKVDVILTGSGAPAALAAKNATSVIPIIFLTGDAVADGLVATLAQPGGNLTGVSSLSTDLTAKRLDLLCELVPEIRLIALLVNPSNPNAEPVIRGLQEAAVVKGVRLYVFKATTEDEIDAAFASLVPLRPVALVISSDVVFTTRREQLITLATRYAVPVVYYYREFAAEGGLISYAPSLAASFRRLGVYAGKILKGAKPADLPVEQPTKFELVINLKTAKALGLTVPHSLLARADEVIE